MRWLAIVAVALGVSCAEHKPGDSREAQHSQTMNMAAGGAAEHIVLRPGDLKWKDGTSLPPGAKFALLEGDPSKEGFFAMRVMMPDGYQIPPHWHPGVERVTVISGTFYLGMGEKFDRSAAQAMPPGTYSAMQPGMRHFAWTQGPTVVQITTMGPWGITYVNPADDPRKK